MPTEAEEHLIDPTHEKEHTMEQQDLKRSYRLFVGVDIASVHPSAPITTMNYEIYNPSYKSVDS